MIQDNRDANGDAYIKKTKELMLAWAVRTIMALALVIGGPIVAWTLNRIVATADDISAAVHAHDTKLEIINDRITGVRETLSDHEGRLRVIEQRPK